MRFVCEISLRDLDETPPLAKKKEKESKAYNTMDVHTGRVFKPCTSI